MKQIVDDSGREIWTVAEAVNQATPAIIYEPGAIASRGGEKRVRRG